MCDISICCDLCRSNVNKKPSGVAETDTPSRSFASYLCLSFLLLPSQHSYCGMISPVSSLWDKGAVFEIRTLVKTSNPMSIAVNYEFSVCLCVHTIQVLWAEQQVVKKRKKRDVYEDPTDPDFPKQWYLVCNPFCYFSLFCFFSYGNTFEVCFKIYLGAHFLCIFIGPLDFILVFSIQALVCF